MEHAHPFDRPFPWRAAALAAAALALAELTALIGLAGVRLFHVHHAAPAAKAQTHAAVPRKGTATQVVPLRPRSRVSVLVLNGNGIAHAAGDAATRLLARGYRHAYPADAPNTYARSVVLFRPGWEREAQRLGRDAGIRMVTPLDTRLPASQSGYQLVLILGAN